MGWRLEAGLFGRERRHRGLEGAASGWGEVRGESSVPRRGGSHHWEPEAPSRRDVDAATASSRPTREPGRASPTRATMGGRFEADGHMPRGGGRHRATGGGSGGTAWVQRSMRRETRGGREGVPVRTRSGSVTDWRGERSNGVEWGADARKGLTRRGRDPRALVRSVGCGRRSSSHRAGRERS